MACRVLLGNRRLFTREGIATAHAEETMQRLEAHGKTAMLVARDGVLVGIVAVPIADLIITATGQRDVVTAEHFAIAKDGCVLANAGHFNVEINVAALKALARSSSTPRANLEEYTLTDGRRLRLLAEGRLVNLAATEGHPAAVMDMSFANQALCAEYLATRRPALQARVHEVPIEIDHEVARLKLSALSRSIDVLTAEQLAYAAAWTGGT